MLAGILLYRLVTGACLAVPNGKRVPKNFGQVLKEMREAARLSQSALAKRVGITQAQLSRLESTKRTYPRFDTMVKLAHAFGLSLDEIAAEAGLLADSSRGRPSATELRSMSRRATRASELLAKADQELQQLAARLDPEQKNR